MQPSNHQAPEEEEKESNPVPAQEPEPVPVQEPPSSKKTHVLTEASAYEIHTGRLYPPPPSYYEKMPLPVEKQPLPSAPARASFETASFTRAATPGLPSPPQTGYQPSSGIQPYPGMPYPAARPTGPRSRKWIWILVSILGAVLLLCGLCTWGIYSLLGPDIQSAFSVPVLVENYYQDVEQGNYATAYTNVQVEGLTQAAFVQTATQRDTQLGNVSSFEISSASPNVSTAGNGTDISSYSVVVATVRRSTTYSVHLTIEEESGNWKITYFDTV